jgi:hypothetical protein
LKECAFCIVNAINGSLNDFRVALIQVVKYDVLFMLIKFLMIFRNEKQLMFYVLSSIKNCLLLDEQIDIFEDSNYRVKISLQKYGLENLLITELQYYPYEEVKHITQEILAIITEQDECEMKYN